MLLGLIILLVLLAWTLGNTITRSTHTSRSELRSRNWLRRIAASQSIELRFSCLKVIACAADWLRRTGLQNALAMKSPYGALQAVQFVPAGRSSECFAMLIGRDRALSFTQRLPMERRFV